MKVVPELYCTDIKQTKRFYIDILGFALKYERKEEQFVCFTRDGVDIMIEGLFGRGRRWLTSDLERPFGRGVNFQWDVRGVEQMYKHISQLSPTSIYLELETKGYAIPTGIVYQKQFVVQDPDGYLFRFCEDLPSHT